MNAKSAVTLISILIYNFIIFYIVINVGFPYFQQIKSQYSKIYNYEIFYIFKLYR